VIAQDLRHAFRTLSRSPRFTAIAAAVVACMAPVRWATRVDRMVALRDG